MVCYFFYNKLVHFVGMKLNDEGGIDNSTVEIRKE